MAGDALMVKEWATEPPPTRAEPVRQYGYALIYIHDITLRRGGQLEVTYAVVARKLFAEMLPAPVERAMFQRWMMRYPFNMEASYGVEDDDSGWRGPVDTGYMRDSFRHGR
jgi:hypothetical protein